MRTCSDCGCVIGDGGDVAHKSWHNRLDMLANAIAQLEDLSGMYDSDGYPPMITIDTKGRT